ncbi:hypothetical protein, partial [Parabacteroides sp.]|uniref:hypothetical protein n=1 Tax=Parabacteroides sp. TaxID=1869337 RepID=UPI00290F9261
MKLKYILNAILFVLALSFLSMCIFKTTELSLKCMQFAVSISCIGAMFSTKRGCLKINLRWPLLFYSKLKSFGFFSKDEFIS